MNCYRHRAQDYYVENNYFSYFQHPAIILQKKKIPVRSQINSTRLTIPTHPDFRDFADHTSSSEGGRSLRIRKAPNDLDDPYRPKIIIKSLSIYIFEYQQGVECLVLFQGITPRLWPLFTVYTLWFADRWRVRVNIINHAGKDKRRIMANNFQHKHDEFNGRQICPAGYTHTDLRDNQKDHSRNTLFRLLQKYCYWPRQDMISI